MTDIMNEEVDRQEDGPVTLPEATETMAGPGKLHMNPKPKSAKRLSKKAGATAIVGCLVLVMILFIGIMSRGSKASVKSASAPASIEAATKTGDAVAHDLQMKEQEQTALAERDAAAQDGGIGPAGVPDLDGTTQQGQSINGVPPLKLSRVGNEQASVPNLNEAGGLTNGGPGRQRRFVATAADKEREAEYKQYLAALSAPTAVSSRGSDSGVGGGVASALGEVGPGAQLLNALAAHATESRSMPSMGGGSGTSGIAALLGQGGSSNPSDQNMQEQKDAFLAKYSQPEKDVYLHATRVLPMTKYEIEAGWDIPAVLEQKIDTDLPGQVKALVRENVYDTATGKYLLIPQGSRLIGSYNSHVSYGQTRVQVEWQRIIFPDGSSFSLGGMVGQDAGGNAGFHYKTNNHYVRLAGMALLTSAFSAGISIAANQGQQSNPYGYESNSQIASQALAQQMGETGMEITRRNLNIQPTITIPIGYEFNVRVNKDMIFEGPYAQTSN